MECLSTNEAGNQGCSDTEQLTYATGEGRAILTFNVRDFVRLAREYADSRQHHSGIIVSDHLPFRELLRRILVLLQRHPQRDFTDTVLWLPDYKTPESS